MEAIFVPSAPEQSVSPYKQIKNPRRNTRTVVSRPSENLVPSNIHGGGGGGGLLFAPPPSLSFSYPPPSASVFNLLHHNQLLHHPYHHQQQQQPALLPLPVVHRHNSLPVRSQSLACPPPTTRKSGKKPRDQSLTPKKSKQPYGKREETNQKDLTTSQTASKPLTIASTNPSGPDPNDLPKDVSKVLLSSSPSSIPMDSEMKDLEKFSGSLFSLAPPPSSLPLPKFSLRSKLSCNAEAAGIDAGATDNLRRLLRLR